MCFCEKSFITNYIFKIIVLDDVRLSVSITCLTDMIWIAVAIFLYWNAVSYHPAVPSKNICVSLRIDIRFKRTCIDVNVTVSFSPWVQS